MFPLTVPQLEPRMPANQSNPKQARHLFARDKGIALIAVTALALVIAVLAIGLTREARMGVKVATSVKARVQAEEAARAIELWAGLQLAARQAGAPPPRALSGPIAFRQITPLPQDGRPAEGRAFGFEAEIRVQAERGKLDLLTAEPALIADLLAKAAIPRATEISRRVADLRAARGGEISWRVDSKPINSLGELAQGLGLDRAQLSQLRTVATVHGGTPMPDPATAPRVLFSVLPLDPDTRRLAVAARSAGRTPVPPGPQTYMITTRVSGPGAAALDRQRRVTIETDGALGWHLPLN